MPALLALHGLLGAVTPEVHVFGTGPDVSYVVIQETSLSPAPLIFAYRYTYTTSPPITGDGLLSIISASFPELQIQTTQYSFGKSLDAIDLQGTTVSSSTAPDGTSGTYWSYYVSGGYDGSGAVATNQWLYSQYGFDSRTIAPGSCDGWTFASWQGTNQPSDLPPSVDVSDLATLVASAAATPIPTPSPTPTPEPATNPMAINVGEGPDVSFVVLQEPSLSSRPIVFAYHYTNASSPPITGYQMLLAIHGGYPDFDFATTQYSFGKSLDAFRFGGTTVSSSTAPDGNGGYYWSYYLCGGFDGSGAVATNAWSYSQYGFESRTIAPGSCDGWTLASWQGTNGMDVPPSIDPTFLSSLAMGYGILNTVTSASPTPVPSPIDAAAPSPSAAGTPSPGSAAKAVPSPSSTPQGEGGIVGGAVTGIILPAGLTQSATPGTVPPSGNAPNPAGSPSSGAPARNEAPRSVSDQESPQVLAAVRQQGYAAPPWLQVAESPASVNLSMATTQGSDAKSIGPQGSLKIMTPFEPEKLPVRNPEGLTSSDDSRSEAVSQETRKEGAASSFLRRITGRMSRFWTSLLQWFHITRA